jgi:hypothetical protein
MPLFVARENYVLTPLESTYMAAFKDMPSKFRTILSSAHE